MSDTPRSAEQRFRLNGQSIGDCRWCDGEAFAKVLIRPARKGKNYRPPQTALVCPNCAERMAYQGAEIVP